MTCGCTGTTSITKFFVNLYNSSYHICIREKIVRYLFERKNTDGTIRGNLVREEMAEYMNVTRPSLSRELGSMQKEGILEIQGRDIRIADWEKFEMYL